MRASCYLRTPTTLETHRRPICHRGRRVLAEHPATHRFDFDSRFFSGTDSRAARAARVQRRRPASIFTLTMSSLGARGVKRPWRISRRSAASAILERVLMAKARANKPLEWTGRYQLSAPPPQFPCLPLRGSVDECWRATLPTGPSQYFPRSPRQSIHLTHSWRLTCNHPCPTGRLSSSSCETP